MDPEPFYRCSDCGKGLLNSGACNRPRNSKGHKICNGHGVPVEVVKGRCKCNTWSLREQDLGTRCHACHRKIERDPGAEATPGSGQN